MKKAAKSTLAALQLALISSECGSLRDGGKVRGKNAEGEDNGVPRCAATLGFFAGKDVENDSRRKKSNRRS